MAAYEPTKTHTGHKSACHHLPLTTTPPVAWGQMHTHTDAHTGHCLQATERNPTRTTRPFLPHQLSHRAAGKHVKTRTGGPPSRLQDPHTTTANRPTPPASPVTAVTAGGPCPLLLLPAAPPAWPSACHAARSGHPHQTAQAGAGRPSGRQPDGQVGDSTSRSNQHEGFKLV